MLSEVAKGTVRASLLPFIYIDGLSQSISNALKLYADDALLKIYLPFGIVNEDQIKFEYSMIGYTNIL